MRGWTLTTLITHITELVALVIPIAFAIALFAFFWTLFRGFGKTDSVDKRAEARQALVWSLIALFVIITLSGIVALFGASIPDLQPSGSIHSALYALR